MLEGCGLVTCAHVLGDVEMFLYSPMDPRERYRVTRERHDNERDVAILEAAGIPKYKELRPGDSTKLGLRDAVTLLGFPEHSKGDVGIVYRGEVTAEHRSRFGQDRILISAPIVEGNSGGPVLDSRNRVIGIAATGTDKFERTTTTLNYGVIPIETLVGISRRTGTAVGVVCLRLRLFGLWRSGMQSASMPWTGGFAYKPCHCRSGKPAYNCCWRGNGRWEKISVGIIEVDKTDFTFDRCYLSRTGNCGTKDHQRALYIKKHPRTNYHLDIKIRKRGTFLWRKVNCSNRDRCIFSESPLRRA